TSVTLSGTNFTGATVVTFNGLSGAPFTVTPATAIQDTVPTGATTGSLSVTTPGGTATSTSVFTVTNTASVSVSPNSLSFGSVTVGSTSAQQDVQIINKGSVGVSVSSMTITGPFAIALNYCMANGTWNGVIAPGTHCDIYAVFAPVAAG